MWIYPDRSRVVAASGDTVFTVGTGIKLTLSSVPPSSTLGQELLAPANTLDGYNNGDFHRCSDGSGLMLGD